MQKLNKKRKKIKSNSKESSHGLLQVYTKQVQLDHFATIWHKWNQKVINKEKTKKKKLTWLLVLLSFPNALGWMVIEKVKMQIADKLEDSMDHGQWLTIYKSKHNNFPKLRLQILTPHLNKLLLRIKLLQRSQLRMLQNQL